MPKRSVKVWRRVAGVSLALMDQLADKARLHKVMSLRVFQVSRGNLLIEQGRDGHLKASITGIQCAIVKTAVSQLTEVCSDLSEVTQGR